MPLTIPEAIGLLPKLLTTVEKGVETVKTITALPVKNAKTIAVALGIATDSALYMTADVIDGIVEAGKS